MKQYQEIIKEVLTDGIERINRTNLKDNFIPSATIKVDLRDGFPALTTKKLYFKQSIGEILGFIRGYESADDFASLGCKFWYSDANENKTWLESPYRKGTNDLGKVYGSIWRNREVIKKVNRNMDSGIEEYLQNSGYDMIADGSCAIYSKNIDQLYDVVDTIINNPNDRRIIMHAWFPEMFDEMALPPCHVMYRFVPDEKNKVLHLSMFQRSCDLFLGVPMNLFGSSLLLALVAEATGYTAGTFTHQMADVHLYENQKEVALEQISRKPLTLPSINIKTFDGNGTLEAMKYLESLEPNDILIENYINCGTLDKVEMAQEK